MNNLTPDPTPQPGVEVQARGPVHEAYAEPTESRPQPSVVVAKQPPQPIDEIPPDQKPEGDNVVWIPGYWAWDDDASNFLWVSGFWRIPPPNHQWMPGGWQQVQDGWQWTPGFWVNDQVEAVDYLPAPPPSIDQGASNAGADDNSIYSPGGWVYRQSRYFWRPGFWVKFQPNWVWTPAHYVWSPGGYLFVEGFWDHPLEQRGLLFAPVSIDPAVVTTGWSYTPQYVVQPDFLLGALFVRPDHCHYYFGDYFEDRYQKSGYVAWVNYRPTTDSYDPNFAYYRHRFNGDRSWETNLRDLYADRFRGDIPRPPRTLVQQNTVIRNLTTNKTTNVTVNKNLHFTNIQNVSALTPVQRINNTKVTNLAALSTAKTNVQSAENHVIRVQAVPKAQQAEVRKAVASYRETAQKRHQAETKLLTEGHAPVKATDAPQQVKIDRPRAPAPSIIPRQESPKAPPARVVPMQPTLPKHEERPIPAHTPPKQPLPPRQTAPAPREPITPRNEPKPTKAEPPRPAPTPSPKLEPPRHEVPRKVEATRRAGAAQASSQA